MTWTYTDPSTSARDAVRFLVGDTDTTDQLVTDEEIAFTIAQAGTGNTYTAASLTADAIAAKFARKADFSNLSISVSASQRAEAFRALAEDLRAKALVYGGGAEVFAGGLSASAKDDLDANTDAVQPSFRMGQDDNKGSA